MKKVSNPKPDSAKPLPPQAPSKKARLKFRINLMQLDDVCLDCIDFLKAYIVNCEGCGVFRLKRRFRKRKDIYRSWKIRKTKKIKLI